ncbi:melanocortin receptor 5-like [Patiria miniata]|uniref:G-protein coupled receptors family 1 profile domain-containing protein n=1 Tax=Patiria miniata TaxID=46514 RepID=A0A914BDR8_PATMI|nr:melanocortin receptor 5-like [Patiria miniata]
MLSHKVSESMFWLRDDRLAALVSSHFRLNHHDEVCFRICPVDEVVCRQSTMGSTLITVINYSGAVILVLAVLENLLVMVVLAATSHLRIKYFAFVFSLALADLAFSVMAIVYALNRARFLSALLQSSFFVSVLMILAVAVNRYLALTITPPSRYDALVTRCRLVVVCLLLWCFSLALHLPVVLVASDEVRLILSAWSRSMLVLAVWIVTAVLYRFVFRKIKSYVPPLASSPGLSIPDDSEQAATRVRQTRRLLVTFSIILVTSFICWIPFNVGQIMEYFIKTGQSTISDDTFNNYNWVCGFIYCLSPAINPLIYWWRLDGFRQGFKELFCRCLLQNQEQLVETVDGNENQQNTESTHWIKNDNK